MDHLMVLTAAVAARGAFRPAVRFHRRQAPARRCITRALPDRGTLRPEEPGMAPGAPRRYSCRFLEDQRRL